MCAQLVIGLAQVWSGRTKEQSLHHAEKLVQKAKNADIIVFPEYLMFDPTGVPGRLYLFSAESLNGPWVKSFQRMAREKSTYVLTTLFEKSGEERRVYNTAILINDAGEVIGIYRKTHLFDAYGYRESRIIKPGEKLSGVYDVKGVKVGIAICFELRFPEIFRSLALTGAELVLEPMAWYRGHLKEEMLIALAKARAHENTIFIATSSLAGENFVGRSIIASPYGHIIADAGPWENYLEQQIDTKDITDSRKILPLLDLRRPELYQYLVKEK
jgi:predicted amidohydrolase